MTPNTIYIADAEISTKFQLFQHALKHAPSKAWEQPVSTCINSRIKIMPDGASKLSPKNAEYCAAFMKDVTRYIYGMALGEDILKGYSMEQEMKYAQKTAEQNKLYQPRIKQFENFVFPRQFRQNLSNPIPKHLQRGLCTILLFFHGNEIFTKNVAQLKPQTTVTEVLNNAVITRFLPDKWTPIRGFGWNIEKIQKAKQTIGDIMLIEPEIHKNIIKICTGDFFVERKNPKTGKGYFDSVFYDVIFDTRNGFDFIRDLGWYYKSYRTRQEGFIKSLRAFFLF